MSDEHWATFSIYDHRTALYRRALLLFDRIVVPVPTGPFGDVSMQEIDELSNDVEYLVQNEAAVRFDWDPSAFDNWQQSVVNESLAVSLNRDPLYATRLQLAEQILPLIPPNVESVTAVPVYRAPESFDSSTETLSHDVQEAVLLEVVMPRLSVPREGVRLSDIVEFRQNAKFRDSIYQLRNWQKQVLPELLKDPRQRDRTLREAAANFDRWINQYSEAMEDAQFAKVKTAVVSVLAVGAVLCPFTTHLVAGLAAVASPLFSLRELRKPCWKIVSERQCAPAAIVYAAEHL